ncbi:signal recognition particle-docking protein FtsY [Erysipelothrix sp. HDW6C]|uniref:signal recognition particle-docking protein FtsY n=1 Tax=Erysipelothrix sp. HDW6C TaxID=2714930 RepID=UPI00140A933F|nr:signal recognition particle-docking protein FtsY [Erysipelothrix sp. HDW6C]QIK70117.1 signal recognition particle-docking protein FtsY [Erysipelothrix sp. HDW6C]
MGFFDKLKKSFSKKEDKELYSTGLNSTKATFGNKLKEMFVGKPKFDDAWYDHLLAVLIQSDVSLKSAQKIIKAFRKEIKPSMTQEESLETLADVMYRQYGENITPYALADGRLNAILVVGVNGSGKTTTCAKLAYHYKEEGKKVLLVGGDTFRAAGSNQLKVWADEIGVDFIGGDEGRDAASVYVDAARHAKENNYDIMICDSAGRLQNKVNLMNELAKMKRVLEREVGSIDHTYLVIDGNTGQNGLSQAKLFTEVTPVDSLIVTKLDGSPKGGVLLSIKDELGIKVSHIGLGEKMEDLRPFDIEAYLYNLVSGS